MLGRSSVVAESSPLRALEGRPKELSAKTKMRANAIGRMRNSLIGLAVTGHVLEFRDDLRYDLRPILF